MSGYREAEPRPAERRGPEHRTARPAAFAADPGVAAILLVHLRPASLPWALWRLARGADALGAVPGLRFARVLGSGRGGGFGLQPGLCHQGLFTMFDSVPEAEAFLAGSELVAAYRRHARECLSAVLRVTQSRGSWAGQAMRPVAQQAPGAPVAALTRAAIRPHKALPFWRHAAPSQAGLASAPGCRLAAGLGEAPLLRQATFSVWDTAHAMEAYAQRGAHHEAVAMVARERCFSESMFVRFALVSLHGRWQGKEHGRPGGASERGHGLA